MEVRLARPGDIPALIEIELSAGELFAGTHMDWAVGQVTPLDELRAAVARGDVWLVEDVGAPVAYLIGDRVDGDFHIDQVSVARSHQRRGLGRLLIEAATAEARTRGHRAATLTTDRRLPWNAPYYLRLGFELLAPHHVPPQLAARLACQPFPAQRCAMRLELV
jgi:GNAT superfamily N-acetyltransferase